MVRDKILAGSIYRWGERNARNAPSKPGVYVFYNVSGVPIYIGEAENLRERFEGYVDSNFRADPCKRKTRKYQRQVTKSHEAKEEELLRSFKQKHGRLPECNDYIA